MVLGPVSSSSRCGWTLACRATLRVMPFNARVIQVLIASPGDVRDERAVVADVIHEWNSVNARERGVVLMPLRWETDTRPDIGLGPQAAINRQIVDHADMVIGVFWTRLGTPTEAAASGTVEELDRVGEAGKPIMLYFSRTPVDPELLDLEEYARLTAFRKRTYPRGLVEKYQSLQEFRVTLTRQLAMQVRDIIQKTAPIPQDLPEAAVTPQLRLTVAGPRVEALEHHSVIRLTKARCIDPEAIPSLEDPSRAGGSSSEMYFITTTIGNKTDPEYYRKLVRWYEHFSVTASFRLALVNDGDRAVHDLHLDTRFTTDVPKTTLSTAEPAKPQRFTGGTHISFATSWEPHSRALRLESLSTGAWAFETAVGVVQVGRTLEWGPNLFWTAPRAGSLAITSTVYSSDAPPFILNSRLDVAVEERELSYRDILASLGETDPKAQD